MKQAVLLLSNRTDYSLQDKYNKLKNTCGAETDVYLLFDSTNGYDNSVMSVFDKIYTFDSSILSSFGYKAFVNRFDGNCHFPVIKFSLEHQEYDYIWTIEDDVIFTGSWNTLFEAYKSNTAGLVASKIRSFNDEPSWFWWDSLGNLVKKDYDKNTLFAAFVPVYRLSREACLYLDKDMREGWYGHFECLMPTIISKHGLKLSDMFDKDFCSESTHTWTTLAVQPFRPNKIYHPIKEKKSSRAYRKNCVISIIDKESIHRNFIGQDRSFDYHIIVRELVFGKYYDEADFASFLRDNVQILIANYFVSHKDITDNCEYFFILDGQLPIEEKDIEELFAEMEQQQLNILHVGFTSFILSKNALLELIDGYSPESNKPSLSIVGFN